MSSMNDRSPISTVMLPAKVDSVTATGTILRIIAKTTPNQHWGVKRALLQRSLAALGEAGFHGPVLPAMPPVPQV